MRKHPLRLAAAVAAALALVMTGCSSGGDSGDPNTLKVWWWETDDSALSTAWKQAVSIFEQEHPGVTVEQELKTYEQMQQSGQLILDSNDTPDVLEYLKGNATAGVVAKAGLLTDLTEVATTRGWKLDNSAQDVGLYDDNGLMGSGKRYGITNYGEYVGVWYNQDLFAQHDVQVPTTFAEFENALKTFADKGVTPLALGSADYPGPHLLYSLALAHMDERSLAAYQRFEGDVDWSAWEKAATTMRQWVDGKYISTDSTGIPAQDAGNAFIAGQYPMFVSGTWWAGQIAEQPTFKTGQFLFPGNELHAGSGGNLWVVPAKAKNKDLAYDFLQITQRPEVQNLLADKGGVPVAAEPGSASSAMGLLVGDRFTELLSGADGGLALYPDFPVAGLNDVLVANTTDLVGGDASPQQVVEAIKAAYDAGKPTA
ncbi:ABC transporter substrate-binding protein [Saccharothrix texasensis]|uniref:Carbohydrate ABC transporter substrate-binding protein (CUT1 family) n=1 Tax=Saccharothrix texasensis TaxID=103734 RepID=A0A3N1GYF6_9PSEU|nr:extracellular solute-binding protein [Saccharothrix texasensis]ROP35062.1 carbohydrate ABC transporter substrate-binding protein (CUT1 family) [Saccharothrix texasensis]